MKKIIITIYFLLSTLTFAQVPFEVGNRWDFEANDWWSGQYGSRDTLIYKISSDTIMPNGYKYFRINPAGNLFKDLFAHISDVFRGRSQTTQNTLRLARETVLKELRIEALNIGANAVIGVDLDYSEFSGQGKSMLFLVASGTAVIVKKKIN